MDLQPRVRVYLPQKRNYRDCSVNFWGFLHASIGLDPALTIPSTGCELQASPATLSQMR
ncbi:hypothetical protein AGR6A_Lc190041 [Agrobacterium sp. NCPPB 925]|nr:hypothetical protein AGR6A_Lc190041 [Agrobacterium sp. NCPPB 925]